MRVSNTEDNISVGPAVIIVAPDRTRISDGQVCVAEGVLQSSSKKSDFDITFSLSFTKVNSYFLTSKDFGAEVSLTEKMSNPCPSYECSSLIADETSSPASPFAFTTRLSFTSCASTGRSGFTDADHSLHDRSTSGMEVHACREE
jgi:hypothetical protein